MERQMPELELNRLIREPKRDLPGPGRIPSKQSSEGRKMIPQLNGVERFKRDPGSLLYGRHDHWDRHWEA